MLKFRTALGINISDGRITLALLRKNKSGVKLLKAAGCPVTSKTRKPWPKRLKN